LTRILIFYRDLFSARATVRLLLGEEEKVLWATLHTVKVVIEVEEAVGNKSGAQNGALHLAGSPRVVRNERYEEDLNNGERWESWHLETMLNSLNVLGGFWGWVHVFTLAVSGHFYYLLRK
jgi:hypothetical protein